MVILGLIATALIAGAFIYLAVRLTISFLKKYRQKKTSKIVAGFVKDMIKDAPSMSLDDLPDEDDIIIAEYDEETDTLVQDLSVSKDNDDSIKSILNKNKGLVVFD